MWLENPFEEYNKVDLKYNVRNDPRLFASFGIGISRTIGDHIECRVSAKPLRLEKEGGWTSRCSLVGLIAIAVATMGAINSIFEAATFLRKHTSHLCFLQPLLISLIQSSAHYLHLYKSLPSILNIPLAHDNRALQLSIPSTSIRNCLFCNNLLFP